MRSVKMNKKKFLIIVTAVLLICSTTFASVLAYDKYVQSVNYKIKLNNRDVNLSKEIVTIDDSTYLPLRALCEEMLGMDVTWHGDQQLIELWNITKPADRGSHEAPIKMNAPVSGEFLAKDKSYVNYDISVLDVERGSGVYSKVENWYKSKNPLVLDSGLDSDKRKKKVEQYNEKVDKYMEKCLADRSVYELMLVKVHIDIKPAAATFEYNTKKSDLVPYCGYANVNGLQRQYVEYDVPDVEMPAEMQYIGRTILTNGIQEGYIVLRVYKDDKTPRFKYKDGQYLALYK